MTTNVASVLGISKNFGARKLCCRGLVSVAQDIPVMSSEQAFDFIICGGGTSGCALAARLAELEWARILVIEAGPVSADLEGAAMPGGWTDIIGTDLDWNDRDASSISSTSGHVVNLTRGKLLGGSSVINGTACVRGTRQDYDDWDMPGWDGEAMFGYMSKAETFHSKPWFNSARADHGYDGPIHTEPHDVAPISQLLMKSFGSAGFPCDHDMFTTGHRPHGVGYAVRSHWKGRRSTGADYLLSQESSKRVTVWTGCLVDRIHFADQRGELRAQSVVFFDVEGKSRRAVAEKEILLSAGSYGSPAILMRSGLGPREHLTDVGIECLRDLPAIGQNLQDHAIVSIFYETDSPGLTLDAFLRHDPQNLIDARELWSISKSGALASIPFGICAFTRLDGKLDQHPTWKAAARITGRDPMGLTPMQPHVEYFSTECLAGLKEHTRGEDRKHVFGMVPVLFSPHSRGTVTLRSSNPHNSPIIQHNYLSHELDLVVMAEACRLANEIVTQHSPTRELVTGSYPEESGHHKFTSEAQWRDWLKKNITTCFHPAGTCKMGRPDDRSAVLDAKLLVRGTTNLRVADCSIMPTLHSGHTQMPAYAIGEKAADIVKDAWKAQLSSKI